MSVQRPESKQVFQLNAEVRKFRGKVLWSPSYPLFSLIILAVIPRHPRRFRGDDERGRNDESDRDGESGGRERRGHQA
jgi:hypothetical protein